MILKKYKFTIIALMAFLIMLLGITVPKLELLSGLLLCTLLILIEEYTIKNMLTVHCILSLPGITKKLKIVSS